MAYIEQTNGAGGDDPSTTLGAPEGSPERPERPLVGTHDIEEMEVRARALEALLDAEVPFLVAGAYAFFAYTGIYRDTKDLDVFLIERDIPAAFEALERAGFRTDLLDDRWIGKAYWGSRFVDLIFSSSNGLAVVDELWFQHAREGEVLGYRCALAPPEEIIFSKAFIEERERYDGADINHLIYACGHELDWERLVARFGPHWEVLLSHLVLYGFVYPGARSLVPGWLMDDLCQRMQETVRQGNDRREVCRGHLISRQQYRHDYEARGMAPIAAAPCALDPGWRACGAMDRGIAVGLGGAALIDSAADPATRVVALEEAALAIDPTLALDQASVKPCGMP